MLNQKQIKLIREELATAKNPLFLYDDDADGLASFLLLYRINREGKGIRANATSRVDMQFMRRIEELQPDKIFVLDIPEIDQGFVDNVKRPIIWIDHHMPQDIKNVHYFNPRLKDKDVYIPTSRMCYQVSGEEEDMWMAAAGCLGDWHMPDFIDAFIKKYKGYLKKKGDLATTIYKNKNIENLVKFFFFILKGPSSEVRKSVKVLSRIKHPDEIFKETTAQGKFLYKRFVKVNERYQEILKQAKKAVSRSKLILFVYPSIQWSFTANLANELRSKYPNKAVVIARRKSGEMKCSIRGENVLTALEKALIGIQGGGGGHPNACGATIKEEDWEQFLKNFRSELKKL